MFEKCPETDMKCPEKLSKTSKNFLKSLFPHVPENSIFQILENFRKLGLVLHAHSWKNDLFGKIKLEEFKVENIESDLEIMILELCFQLASNLFSSRSFFQLDQNLSNYV